MEGGKIFTMKNGSFIHAMQVTIVGESAAVTLEDTSMISASGLSTYTYGTGGEGSGASFLG